MPREQEFCPECGELITKIIFYKKGKVIREIYFCNCNNEDSE